MDDVYGKLKEWMHSITPMGYPDTDPAMELLKYLFTPEEAELAVHLRFDLETPEVIAERCGKDSRETADILEKMYLQGTIRKHAGDGGNTYAALAFVPGIVENLVFVRGSDQKLTGMVGGVFFGDLKRLIDHDTAIMRTLPVETALPADSAAVPYQRASGLIEKATGPIVVFPCLCRSAKPKEDRCNSPMEVCMAFGDHARFYLDTGVAGRKIDKEEALKILRIAEEGGLVHQVVNYTDDELSWLCNCCGCCCAQLSANRQLYPEGKVKGTAPSPG
jgi:hypothetical protein